MIGASTGEAVIVWRWAGQSTEMMSVTYLGRTEHTGEHVVAHDIYGIQIVGRHVFDTETQARWWGLGMWEASRMLADYAISQIQEVAK